MPLATGAGGCTTKEDPATERFQHGIASGDPLPDAVILWTRVTAGDGSGPVDADWEVAEDPQMTKRVAGGVARTDAGRDFTVKVDVRGLQPGKTYYYRFRSLGGTSKVGRTRTAPGGTPSRLRLALVACASLAHGYFHGYRAISKLLDLDAVIHLGDYIYEYGDGEYGDVRGYRPPTEILTLADYRTRHAHYVHVLVITESGRTRRRARSTGARNSSIGTGHCRDTSACVSAIACSRVMSGRISPTCFSFMR